MVWMLKNSRVAFFPTTGPVEAHVSWANDINKLRYGFEPVHTALNKNELRPPEPTDTRHITYNYCTHTRLTGSWAHTLVATPPHTRKSAARKPFRVLGRGGVAPHTMCPHMPPPGFAPTRTAAGSAPYPAGSVRLSMWPPWFERLPL